MAKSNKREVILLAAAKLFRERGYQATSMRDLAEAVQLKASSLYNHIGSKEEMLQEICMLNADKFSQGMEEISKRSITSIEKIKALIRLHVQIALNDYTAITSFNDEWRHLTEPALSKFMNHRKDYEQNFILIINAAIEERSIREIDPQIFMYTLLSSIRWIYDSSEKDADKITTHICSILIEGIHI